MKLQQKLALLLLVCISISTGFTLGSINKQEQLAANYLTDTEAEELLDPKLEDYQLRVTQNSIIIFSDGKFIDSIPWDSSRICSILLNDNL